MDGFIPVTYKKKRKGKPINKRTPPHTCSEKQNNVEIFDALHCKRRIDECIDELQRSSFWSTFLDIFRSCTANQTYDSIVTDNTTGQTDNVTGNTVNTHRYKEIVIYGIGSIANSQITRYQLAFCYLFKEKLQIASHFYEPVLSEKEKEILLSYGFIEIYINEECKRLAEEPTIFIMLHCGKAMYNNLLWKNWTQEYLQNLCIIGNSFNSYLERVPSSVLTDTAKYLLQIIPYTVEHPIKNIFLHEDIFNDTSIHIFNENNVSTIPEDVLSSNEEPYSNDDDVEIICRKLPP